MYWRNEFNDCRDDAAGRDARSGFGAGRLDLPPDARSLWQPRPAFGQRFMVFVDTAEPFDRRRPVRRPGHATAVLQYLAEGQKRMAAHGVCPVYLVDYPVAESAHGPDLIGPWLDAGQAHIGAQLHPWSNPPFREEFNEHNSFLRNLSVSLERMKLRMLTGRIDANFGVRPVCFRAGRGGIGPASAMLLNEAGYRIDASVRPYFSQRWAGGPNFFDHPARPYWAGPKGQLLEIPASATIVGRWQHYALPWYRGAARLPLLRRLLARCGLAERVALTPESTDINKALEAVRILYGEGLPLFNLSYQALSLNPGHLPYVRDATDLRHFHRWWGSMFGLLAALGVRPIGQDELLAFIDARDQDLR